MKRTQMKRSSFRRDKFARLRRSPMKPISSVQRRKQAQWREITRQAIEAAYGICQAGIAGVCTRVATDGHHRLSRGRGGKNTFTNCLALCRQCHDYIETHRTWAQDAGLLLSAKGAE